MFDLETVKRAADLCLKAAPDDLGRMWLMLPEQIAHYPEAAGLPYPRDEITSEGKAFTAEKAAMVIADILAYTSGLGITAQAMRDEITAECSERGVPWPQVEETL